MSCSAQSRRGRRAHVGTAPEKQRTEPRLRPYEYIEKPYLICRNGMTEGTPLEFTITNM